MAGPVARVTSTPVLGGGGPIPSAARPWTPAKLPGSAFYFAGAARPDLLTYVSTTHLSAAKDAGTSGLTLVQGTDAARIVLDAAVTLNGRASFKLTNAASSSIGVTSGGVTGAHAMTVACVAQIDESPVSYHMIASFGAVGVSSENFGIGTANPTAAAAGFWAGGFGHVAAVGGVDVIPSGGYTANGAGDACLALDHNPHLLMATSDTAKSRVYCDGYLCIAPPTANVGSGSPIADTGYNIAAGLGVQSYAAPGFTTSCHIWEAPFNSTVLTPAQRRQVEAYARSTYGSSIGYALALLPQLICGIDSLTFGVGATHGTSDYVSQMIPLLSKTCTVWPIGISGRLLATAQAAVESDVAGHSTGFAPSNTFVALAGTNEMINSYATAGYAATLYAALVVYWQSIKVQSPGIKVVACTLIHANPAGSTFIASVSAYNAQIDALNVLIRAGYATYCDALADIGADPTKLAFFTDGLHQTAGTGIGTGAATGYAMFATVIAVAANALI